MILAIEAFSYEEKFSRLGQHSLGFFEAWEMHWKVEISKGIDGVYETLMSTLAAMLEDGITIAK